MFGCKKGFVPLLTLSLDADVKNTGKFTKKDGTVPRVLPQTHDHKVVHYKLLLKSLDYVCISTFININLIQLPEF
jgi:hypothetical protein